MKNVSMDVSFYKKNRERLSELLKNNSAAVINSNDIMPSNADGTMRFRQNSDLFYLTGILQEESVLLLHPDSSQKKYRENLFIRGYNPDVEVWEGKKLSPEDAGKISGVETVLDFSHFTDILHDIM
jgi:Xaa-Pro aminopeptidase